MEKYLLTAKAIKTIGLKGDIKIYSSTTFEDLRYKKGSILYLKNNDEYLPYEIEKASFKGGNIFQIKLKNVDTIEDAEKGKSTYIKKTRVYKDLIKFINNWIFCIHWL